MDGLLDGFLENHDDFPVEVLGMQPGLRYLLQWLGVNLIKGKNIFAASSSLFNLSWSPGWSDVKKISQFFSNGFQSDFFTIGEFNQAVTKRFAEGSFSLILANSFFQPL